MKIPKLIRIGGIDYEIRDVDNLNDGMNDYYGQISFEDSVIELNAQKQSHQRRCVTLWHEILHGIAEHASLDIENEEQVIDVLAKGIYQVLQDNSRALFDIVERGDAFA